MSIFRHGNKTILQQSYDDSSKLVFINFKMFKVSLKYEARPSSARGNRSEIIHAHIKTAPLCCDKRKPFLLSLNSAVQKCNF